MNSFDEYKKKQNELIVMISHLSQMRQDYKNEITKNGQDRMKNIMENLDFFKVPYENTDPLPICKRVYAQTIASELVGYRGDGWDSKPSKTTKRIFSENDPYGEENWED